MAAKTMLIACGALAKEFVELRRQNKWNHVKIQCLPARLHNRPELISGAVEETIKRYRDEFEHIFVAYADCGTGGRLDQVLEKYKIERIPGAHCYEFLAGASAFRDLSDSEPGTFYLTDFLARHFDRLVIKGLGLDRHPELKRQYFGNYKKLVYLAQSKSEKLAKLARRHSAYLGLEFAVHFTGLEPVRDIVQEHVITWRKS